MDVLRADDGCWVDGNPLADDVYADSPLTDGGLGTSGTLKAAAAAALPYSKLTKFKLCADELEDSSASFIAAEACLRGVFDRFA